MEKTSLLLICILAFFLAHFVQPYANSGVSKAIMMLLMTIGFLWPIVFIGSIYQTIKSKKGRLVTKKRIGVAILFALTFPLALLSYIPPEGIFLFNPDIDT